MKTISLKKVSAVAVAALAFGGLTSVAPANAAIATGFAAYTATPTALSGATGLYCPLSLEGAAAGTTTCTGQLNGRVQVAYEAAAAATYLAVSAVEPPARVTAPKLTITFEPAVYRFCEFFAKLIEVVNEAECSSACTGTTDKSPNPREATATAATFFNEIVFTIFLSFSRFQAFPGPGWWSKRPPH